MSSGLRRATVGIAVRKALVDVLVEAGFADDRSIRSLMLGELRAALKVPFAISDQLTARDQLIEIVNICSRVDDGMAILAAVLELMRPGTPEYAEVHRLVSALPVHDVVPEAEQERLRRWLAGFTPSGLVAAARRAARNSAPPPKFEDAWAAFCFLADFNAAPGELPPALIFVELIATECAETRRGPLRDWTNGQARRYRLDTALDELRAELAQTRRQGGKLHLMIVVQPDGIEPDRYLVCSWRQDEPDEWPPPCGDCVLVRAPDLEDHVDDLVVQAERAWSGRAADVVLEFVLPRSLLNIPVHRWATERRSGDPQPLFLTYPIVVRSLERMTSRQWHRRWRVRWSALMTDPSMERVYFCQDKDTEEQLRLGAILSDQQWVMMVLSESPPARPIPGHDQLFTAFRAGLPALVWHPSAGSDVLREVVAWLVGGDRLGDLPARTQESRQAVFQGRQVPFDIDVFRDLVVLWDDPSRLVFLGDDVPDPSEQGGFGDNRAS